MPWFFRGPYFFTMLGSGLMANQVSKDPVGKCYCSSAYSVNGCRYYWGGQCEKTNKRNFKDLGNEQT